MISEGLERREIIALVNENYMFSVGFRKMPSGDECWANAVPADKSRHSARTSGENMTPKTPHWPSKLHIGSDRESDKCYKTLCQAIKSMLLRVVVEGPDCTSKRAL